MYFQTQFSVNICTLNQFSNSTFRETSVSVQYSWVYTNTTQSVNTLKNAKKVTYTKSGLVKNKVYYITVRAYKKDANGKKFYSSYSTVKAVRVR